MTTTEATETTQETPATGETTGDPQEPQETDTGAPVEDVQDTFPREYVERLRRESAGHRSRGRLLATQLTTAIAGELGVLHDPSDLPYSDDFLNEDGMPDRDRIEAAVTDLVARKPHLARIRPTGDVGQGSSGTVNTAGLLDIFNGRS